jgi:SLOG cluster2
VGGALGGHSVTYSEPLSRKLIGLSISDSDDLPQLGLAEEHLRDALCEITRHLLALGARLAYGGDLRERGFSELLFELAARHRRDADAGDTRPAIVSYLAWPVHCRMGAVGVRALCERLDGLAEVHCLDVDGQDIATDALPGGPVTLNPGDVQWPTGLTACRRLMTNLCDARVVLGGRTAGFMGSMPGIAEEALGSLNALRPLFLLGGFGGCARDITVELQIPVESVNSQVTWPGRDAFAHFDVSDLANGLTADENAVLFRTVHVDEAVALVLRGLLRLFGTFDA